MQTCNIAYVYTMYQIKSLKLLLLSMYLSYDAFSKTEKKISVILSNNCVCLVAL